MRRINTLDRASNNSEKLKIKMSSFKVLKKSLEILKPNFENLLRKLIFLCVEGAFSWQIISRSNTMQLTKDVIGILISILIAIMAIAFTGYAFFQALINDKLLIALLSVDDKEGNLIDTNNYFAEVMVFQMFCTIVNVFTIIFAIVVPVEWCAYKSNTIVKSISWLVLLCMMHINIEAIWEMKSFIFNVYQLFNLHAYARIKTIEEKQNQE